jgi:hypothetical protein
VLVKDNLHKTVTRFGSLTDYDDPRDEETASVNHCNA